MNKVTRYSTLVLFAVACAGTETQNPANPLVSFNDSGCKKENGSKSVAAWKRLGDEYATAAQAVVSTDYSAETSGLKCFAWEVSDGGQVKIDLINFESSCGPKFVGDAKLDSSGVLQLSVTNPGCMVADCGSCIYDWSYEVAAIDTSKPLAVRMGIDVCPGREDIEYSTTSLPVNTQPSGILCKYASYGALGWQAAVLSECGQVGMPCLKTPMCTDRGGTGGTTDPTCEGELVCTDNGNTEQRICAKTCTGDPDCGSKGVLSCMDGLCRPRNAW